MSWGLGWKRPVETFRLVLNYGTEDFGDDLNRSSTSSSASTSSSSSGQGRSSAEGSPTRPVQDQDARLRVDLYWTAGEDEEQVTLKLQSQLMVALPSPRDSVAVNLKQTVGVGEEWTGLPEENVVKVEMNVETRRDPLRGVILTKAGEGQKSDGIGILTRLLRSDIAIGGGGAAGEGVAEGIRIGGGCGDHWRAVTLLSLYGCGLSVLPPEIFKLPLLEKLYLDNNKITVLPADVGELKNLKILSVDYNALVSVPVELRLCVGLVELSLEHNKLVRPLLDFRAMAELEILRLFGNSLEYLPDILPLHKLRHLSLANIRIVADENLRSVSVQIEAENASYFGASKHKLSAFFSLIFRFSSCHHPLLASALAKIMQDPPNCVVVGKDENAVRQLISMISSDNCHVVEQACCALSALAEDVSVALQLMKCDIMKPIESVMKSVAQEGLISVLQVLSTMAFTSDTVAHKMLTKDILKSLKSLCAHKNTEVQRAALVAVGNMAFSLENRTILVTSESLRDLLLRLTVTPEPHVNKAAARALAILGENEILRRAVKGRPVAKQGLRILSMDGGGMKGLATVQILKAIEKETGKRIHELFDLICGTSTGGMLAVALGIKLMTLAQCEEIYKNLGKLVFAETVPKDSEAASWKEKLDQIYKSSSQNFRVVVHGSKHSADQFERLLKEMCGDEDGDLLIESAVKSIPKVFVVSTLVSVGPAQPFVFRNYQYPPGTPEVSLSVSESSSVTAFNLPTSGAHVAYKRTASIGSCKHKIWQAIRASSAAPYYLDDFSVGANRWQDGAIVANNPTIFAIREAQLLWPDTKIDCLVSIGCGSVPTKVRRGGWRYLDTGQVLIESACSVDRVDEALSTLLPMLPDIQYFRFNPVDERCEMELDETDPAVWLKLEAAVEEYILSNSEVVNNLCENLVVPYHSDDKLADGFRSEHFSKTKVSNTDESSPILGWRRSLLLVESMHSPDSGRAVHHARALESFCAQSGIKLSQIHGIPGFKKSVSGTAFPSPFTSPLITGSFPSTPLLYSPDLGYQRAGQIDLVPPLSLDGIPVRKGSTSPPLSPGRKQFSLPAKLLYENLQNLPQVGVVHLSLQNDSYGSILGWQNDVFVVAEPGELAERFLQNVKLSLLSSTRMRQKNMTFLTSSISSITELVRQKPSFRVGNVIHRYIGRQTHVMEDDQEIGAYMFRRTVPFLHLTPDDVRKMVGAWRDRIVVCSGTYGPTSTLIKAFIDSGAKAVVCSSLDPQDIPMISHDVEDFSIMENGKFEIGDEASEDEEVAQPGSPESDWEDGDREKHGDPPGFSDENEEELSRFICQLYDSLFRKGDRVDVALQKALSSHKKMRFTCHLPSV